MPTKANTGRSGATLGKQKRSSTPKGGKNSRDNGEVAGQMTQKGLAFSPQAKHGEVAVAPAGVRKQVTPRKKS